MDDRDQVSTAKILGGLAVAGLFAFTVTGNTMIAVASGIAGVVGGTAAVRHRRKRSGRGRGSPSGRARGVPMWQWLGDRLFPAQPRPRGGGGGGTKPRKPTVGSTTRWSPFGTQAGNGKAGPTRSRGCSSSKCPYSTSEVAICKCACNGRGHGKMIKQGPTGKPKVKKKRTKT